MLVFDACIVQQTPFNQFQKMTLCSNEAISVRLAAIDRDIGSLQQQVSSATTKRKRGILLEQYARVDRELIDIVDRQEKVGTDIKEAVDAFVTSDEARLLTTKQLMKKQKEFLRQTDDLKRTVTEARAARERLTDVNRAMIAKAWNPAKPSWKLALAASLVDIELPQFAPEQQQRKRARKTK